MHFSFGIETLGLWARKAGVNHKVEHSVRPFAYQGGYHKENQTCPVGMIVNRHEFLKALAEACQGFSLISTE